MMDLLLALPTRLSNDPLGLFLAVGAVGLTTWLFIYTAWKVIRGVPRPPA